MISLQYSQLANLRALLFHKYVYGVSSFFETWDGVWGSSSVGFKPLLSEEYRLCYVLNMALLCAGVPVLAATIFNLIGTAGGGYLS